MPDGAFPGGLVVDGHLDLATNALLFGRDLTVPARETRAKENRTRSQVTVALPDLVAGRVGILFATIWALPAKLDIGVGSLDTLAAPAMRPYSTPEEAEVQGLTQLDLYRHLAEDGAVRLILSKGDLSRHVDAWTTDGVPGLVILMEGADPIVRPEDVPAWWERGLRIVGPAWGRTRYAGGTGAPGGLTPEGRELVAAMRETGMVLDISHLADEAFADAMEVGPGRVIASHSSARALVPGDRQLTDEMIRAVGDRDGIVGLPLYNLFLDKAWRHGSSVIVRADDQFRRHAEHIAGLIGWDRVGIGSDLDGGFGLLESPEEIDTVADLSAVAAALPEEARAGVLGGNWLRFLRQALPD